MIGLLGRERINPLTALKLYKTVTLTSSLYGCELWNELSGVERMMLERLQRFCAKVIQNLPRRTRSNICCQMLGLNSMEGYIDSMKLKFFRRLAALPSYCLSKKIFLRRLFQAILLKDMRIVSGFSAEILTLLQKYNLHDNIDSFLIHGYIPDKPIWKKIVSRKVAETEIVNYNEMTQDDHDFKRFKRIHPNINLPSPIWRVARENPSMLSKCYTVAKVIANPCADEAFLCEFCGRLFTDKIEHYVCDCNYTQEERDTFWDILYNTYPISVSTALFNMSDSDMVDILLGGPFNAITDMKDHIHFMTIAINFISKLSKKVNLL